jgi:hypothetical protein
VFLSTLHLPPARSALHAVARAVVALIASAVLAACNIVGPAMVLMQGPPKTEAQFTLDARRPHIVLVDDMKSRLPKRSLRDAITQRAEEALLEQKILAPDMLIASRAVQRALADDRSGKPKPISAIGADAGAAVVIYVTMDRWGLSQDGRTAAPIVEGRVKVIDCEANRRLWPAADTGFTLRLAPKMQQGDLPQDLGGRSRMEQALAQQFGLALAQLFYTHENSQSATR